MHNNLKNLFGNKKINLAKSQYPSQFAELNIEIQNIKIKSLRIFEALEKI